MSVRRHKSIDFNTLLICADVVVAGLLVFSLYQKDDSGIDYVNHATMLLAILLSVQTYIALLIERKRRDPFVLLLAVDMIFFYALRVFTLRLYPFSVVFDRYPYGASDSNHALIFIIVANCFLYAGLYLVRPATRQVVSAAGWRASSPWAVVLLLVASITVSYFGGANAGAIPRSLNFLALFISPSVTVLMALAYYVLFKNSLGRIATTAIATLVAVEMVAHTLYGSRSAILVFLQYCMFVAFAIYGGIRFKRKYLFAGLVLLPILGAVLIGAFVISTYNRSARDGSENLNLSQSITFAEEASSRLSVGSSLDILLPPIASRAGYFDFSAEIIAHREEYASVLNLKSYAKSIVDNILTPGFDIYDQPKIANSLYFIYEGFGTPSKARVSDSYQSDQLGIYGEFYALFGYACLPLLLLIAFTLKRIYVGIHGVGPFMFVMKRIVVLSVFLRTIDSFGVDWTLIEALTMVASMYGYSVLFAARRVFVDDGKSRLPVAFQT